MKCLLINERNEARRKWYATELKPRKILLSGLETILIQPNPINFDREECALPPVFIDLQFHFRELEYHYDILGAIYEK